MKKRTKLLFLWVATLVAASESEHEIPNEEPIVEPENENEPRRLNTPEVVLQLKYDRGALDRIYLAQFRQGASVSAPSVPARTNLCSDLCHAGLGGDGCGPRCKDLIPIGLDSALHQASTNTNATELVGEPRTAVCPTLCANRLGEPLCNCEAYEPVEYSSPNWSAICYAFCQSDRYILGGCPACNSSATPNTVEMVNIQPRILATSDGWAAWCNIQCRQGQGGAACNCDRAPFQ